MRSMKYGLALVLLLSLIVLPALGADGFPVTIVDSANRTVTIDKPVEKIIPLVTWSYEPIWVLGAKDKVVAVTSNAKDKEYMWLPGIQDKPSVGTYKEPDFERIIEIHPDLVITQPKYIDTYEKKLAPAGIPVIALNFNNLATFDKEFRILASILGGDTNAESFISWKQSILNKIGERTAGISSKAKIYANWCDMPLLSASTGSGFQEVINMSGGVNIASSIKAKSGFYPQVDPEWVVKENPDAIVVAASGCKENITGYAVENIDGAKKLAETNLNTNGLNLTKAAKNGRIFVIDGFCVEAVRGFVGSYYLAKWLYPDQFKDLNPEDIHREYFKKWLGMPYKGIWTYPAAN